MAVVSEELPDVTVGVLFAAPDVDIDDLDFDGMDVGDGELPGTDAGHVPAWGERGRHAAPRGARVALLGQRALVHSAEAIGREIGLVINAVVTGMQAKAPTLTGTSESAEAFAVDNLELKFGVKATLASGKAIHALLTASGEATVEVKVTLRQQAADERP